MTIGDKLKFLTNNGEYVVDVHGINGRISYRISDIRHDLAVEITGQEVEYYILDCENYEEKSIDMDALNDLVKFVDLVKDVLKEKCE